MEGALRAGKAQTWVPRDLTGIKHMGRRNNGDQSGDKEAEESTHFRQSCLEREGTSKGGSSSGGGRQFGDMKWRRRGGVFIYVRSNTVRKWNIKISELWATGHALAGTNFGRDGAALRINASAS
jgi:hypothetical protein